MTELMPWLAPPAEFRKELRAAMELSTPAERLTRLAALAQHRLGFVETIQLERVLAETDLDTFTYPRVKLAILASTTVHHLVPGIRVGGLRRGVLIDAHVGGYGQQRQELLDPASSVRRFEPEVV